MSTSCNETLIVYPCDFPIKIMGIAHEDFLPAVAEVILLYAPDFDVATLKARPSAKGTYLSVTATVRATSRQQLDDLYRALTSHPKVKVVL